MRKKRVFLLFVLMMLLVTIVLSLLPITARDKVIVHSSIYEVALQFNKLPNWKNWNNSFDSSYVLTVLNPAAATIQYKDGNTMHHAIITAVPYNTESTLVEWSEKTNGWQWLSSLIGWRGRAVKPLNELKAFMEDDARRYGFEIKLMPVADTLILTRKKDMLHEISFADISLLLQEMKEFIRENGLPVNGDYFFVSKTTNSDNSLQLAVGIPVQVPEVKSTRFEVLKLPATGRLLTGTYNGRYADIQALYLAMDKYIMDKRLKKVAQPLEKYNFSDTALINKKSIKITLYYPVF